MKKMPAQVFFKTRFNSELFQYYGGCGIGDRFLVLVSRITGEIKRVKISRPENATVNEVIRAVKEFEK